jgi:hypothetical protein
LTATGQQAPGFWAQKLSYFWPLEPADGGALEPGAAVPPAAVAVPSLDAPPVPPPVPVVPEAVLEALVPEDVPVEAVAPPAPPVEPVPLGAGAVPVGVAVGVAVELPLVSPELVPLAAPAPAPAGWPGSFGIDTEAGGPGTSGASGWLPPQPATPRVASSSASRPRRAVAALNAAGRTSGGRMWGSR